MNLICSVLLYLATLYLFEKLSVYSEFDVCESRETEIKNGSIRLQKESKATCRDEKGSKEGKQGRKRNSKTDERLIRRTNQNPH